MSLERLWLAAYLEGLHQIAPAPAVRLVELPARPVRLDDTDRPPVVPLRPAGGTEALTPLAAALVDAVALSAKAFGALVAPPEDDRRA